MRLVCGGTLCGCLVTVGGSLWWRLAADVWPRSLNIVISRGQQRRWKKFFSPHSMLHKPIAGRSRAAAANLVVTSWSWARMEVQIGPRYALRLERTRLFVREYPHLAHEPSEAILYCKREFFLKGRAPSRVLAARRASEMHGKTYPEASQRFRQDPSQG